MKHNPNKLKSITLGLAASLAFVAAIVPATAGAEDPPPTDRPADEDESDDVTRFEERLTLSPDRPSIDFRVWRPDDERRRIWHLEASSQDRPDDAICRGTIPYRAGEDYYEISLEHLETERGTHLLLLESEARDGEGPLDPPIFQVALYLVPRTGATDWSCSVIGRGEYSTLDGGPRLSFQEIDDHILLTRHELTDDVTFCGLRPDEEEGFDLFDPEIGRFVRGTPLEVGDEDAEPLQAVVPDSPIPPPLTHRFYSWMSATSDIRGAPAGVAVPRPLMLGNLDVQSPWVEGADGLGRGEYVTAGINTVVPLRGLRIFPGHGESASHYAGYARPTRILIGLSDGHRFDVEIPDTTFETIDESGGLYIEFPEPLTTRCISVMILDAEEGELVDDARRNMRHLGHAVAIGEITSYSTLDGIDEDQTAYQIVAEIGREPSMERRSQIAELGDMIPEAMVRAVDDVLKRAEETRRTRAVMLLSRLPHEQALPVLEDHFHRVSAEDEDYRRTKRAIVAHGPLAAPTLLDILDDLEKESRKQVDTIRLLGRVGSDIHLVRLIVDLGEGSDTLRRERIRAISNGGIGVVPRLISVAHAEGDNDRGLDALTALVFVGQRHFAQQQAEVDGAHKLLATYRQSDSRPHRIRAIEALGYFFDPDGAELLGGELLVDDPDPVIRTFAARALQLYPCDFSRGALEEGLEDGSPDVRIAAIKALNHRRDGTRSTKAVIEYARSERWPRGLHHAMQLLARSSDPMAHATLADIIEEDVQAPAASTALRGLRRYERSFASDRVSALISDPEVPTRISEQLVQMLAFSDEQEARQLLIEIANRTFPPLKDRDQREVDSLSGRAFLALGRSGHVEARQVLLDVVDDEERSDRDRGNALRGLAFFADEELIDILQDLAPRIPRQLRGRFRETLRMIQNRITIEDTQEDLQHLIDRLDEEIEESPPDW